MKKTAVSLDKAYLLLNHGPVTLISTAYDGKQNVMAASWVMPLDFSPPKLALVIDSQSYTHALMQESRELVVNIPSNMIAEKVLSAGGESGRNMDKFAHCGLQTEVASMVAAPLVKGCLAWLECKLIPEQHIESTYDLFVVEVVAAWADTDVFDGTCWRFTEESQRTMHYISNGNFLSSGDLIPLS